MYIHTHNLLTVNKMLLINIFSYFILVLINPSVYKCQIRLTNQSAKSATAKYPQGFN